MTDAPTATLHGLTLTEAGRIYWRLRDLRDGLSGRSYQRVTRMIIRIAEYVADNFA